jgi:hypothetical protein
VLFFAELDICTYRCNYPFRLKNHSYDLLAAVAEIKSLDMLACTLTRTRTWVIGMHRVAQSVSY